MARRPAQYADQDAERARFTPVVAAGLAACRRGNACLEAKDRGGDTTIRPDEPWDVGHPDAVCAAPMGPEHRRCNRATMTWGKPTRPAEQHPALRALKDGR